MNQNTSFPLFSPVKRSFFAFLASWRNQKNQGQQAAQKDLRGKAHEDRSFGFAQDRLRRRRMSEMGCWSVGLEYWVLNSSLHYSIIPVPQSPIRWSEAVERTLRRCSGRSAQYYQ